MADRLFKRWKFWFAVTVETIDWKKFEEAKKYRNLGDMERAHKVSIGAYKAHLIVVDNKGNELWREENIATEGSDYCPIIISDDDTITVMTGVGEYKIYRFNKKGELLQIKQGTLEQLRKIDNMRRKGLKVNIDEIIK